MNQQTNVNLIPLETLETAQIRAQSEAANTSGLTVPVIIFRQGSRTNLIGAFQMGWINTRLYSSSAAKGASILDARSSLNRPEDPSHSAAIAQYLMENHDSHYILPPLTLNVQQKTNLYTINVESQMKPGYLVIPSTAKLAITDGQHRRSGILKALADLSEEAAQEFSRDSIAVMITCETEPAKIHQDFADCSKTKALSRSQLAVYDLRNPANRIIADLEDKCLLFRGKIDSNSKTLSKKSTRLFLANQLRQLIKELLVGSYAQPDVEFEKRAREQLSETAAYEDALTGWSEYLNYLTERIPVWKRVAKIAPTGVEAAGIPKIRAEGWICLTATGLNIIGRVGHNILLDKDTRSIWTVYADELAKLDWSREAAMWQGSIIQGSRIMTQQSPVRNAYEKVRQAIGLD